MNTLELLLEQMASNDLQLKDTLTVVPKSVCATMWRQGRRCAQSFTPSTQPPSPSPTPPQPPLGGRAQPTVAQPKHTTPPCN